MRGGNPTGKPPESPARATTPEGEGDARRTAGGAGDSRRQGGTPPDRPQRPAPHTKRRARSTADASTASPRHRPRQHRSRPGASGVHESVPPKRPAPHRRKGPARCAGHAPSGVSVSFPPRQSVKGRAKRVRVSQRIAATKAVPRHQLAGFRVYRFPRFHHL